MHLNIYQKIDISFFMHVISPKNRKAFERHIVRHMFPTFLLWYISKHKAHGYGLIKQLESEEGFRVVTASQIYPVLKSLMKRGLISQELAMQGRRARKVYRITRKGAAALAQARECMCRSPLRREFLREMAR